MIKIDHPKKKRNVAIFFLSTWKEEFTCTVLLRFRKERYMKSQKKKIQNLGKDREKFKTRAHVHSLFSNIFFLQKKKP